MKNLKKLLQHIRNINYIGNLNCGNRASRRQAKKLIKKQ
jgi:hypothetical protein